METQLLDGRVPANIVAAAKLVATGGVVAVPTDTLYGLAASVFDEGAVARIFQIKRRPAGEAMPVLLASARDSSLVAMGIPREAWPLIDRFWPGPLTLVLAARPSLSALIRAGGSTVAVRVPAGTVLLQLLEALSVPVTGTSANIHGAEPTTSADEVAGQFRGHVDAVLMDPDSKSSGLPSTVVELIDGMCLVHRRGAIHPDLLRETLGPRLRVQVRA